MLYDAGNLTELDRAALMAYCVSYSHYKELSAKLAEIKDPEEKSIYQELVNDYKEMTRNWVQEFFLEFYE